MHSSVRSSYASINVPFQVPPNVLFNCQPYYGQTGGSVGQINAPSLTASRASLHTPSRNWREAAGSRPPQLRKAHAFAIVRNRSGDGKRSIGKARA